MEIPKESLDVWLFAAHLITMIETYVKEEDLDESITHPIQYFDVWFAMNMCILPSQRCTKFFGVRDMLFLYKGWNLLLHFALSSIKTVFVLPYNTFVCVPLCSLGSIVSCELFLAYVLVLSHAPSTVCAMADMCVCDS